MINNSSKLCGGVSGSECDFSAWNPNTEMLTFVAGGSGGLAGTGNGILMDNSSQFQGGLFSSYAVRFANNARSDGPIVGCEPSCLFTLRDEHRALLPAATGEAAVWFVASTERELALGHRTGTTTRSASA